MPYVAFYAVNLVILFAFAFLYIKVTPYNELDAVKQNKIVPAIPLLGSMIAVTACLVTAQVVTHSLLGAVMAGVVGAVSQLAVYWVFERIMFNLGGDGIRNDGNNLAINVMLFVLNLCIGAVNVVSMIPY